MNKLAGVIKVFGIRPNTLEQPFIYLIIILMFQFIDKPVHILLLLIFNH